MYCSKCGTQLTDDGICPNCNTVPTEPVNQSVSSKNIKGPGKGAKSYAALFTALLVFPASLCTAIDLSFHQYDFWFGYVVGALIVVWVCGVLPALDITPAPVTAIICFVSIVGYIFFIMYKSEHFELLFRSILPLCILFAAFIAIDTALVTKKVDWMKFLAVLSLESGLYLIAIEAFWKQGLDNLRWSPILSCGFISVSAVFLAFSYIKTVNKK